VDNTSATTAMRRVPCAVSVAGGAAAPARLPAAAASLAQLNYNISQMTGSAPPSLSPGPVSAANLFNSSLASSLPPSVSSSF